MLVLLLVLLVLLVLVVVVVVLLLLFLAKQLIFAFFVDPSKASNRRCFRVFLKPSEQKKHHKYRCFLRLGSPKPQYLRCFSPTAELCYGVFCPDQLCDPVQLQNQLPGKVAGGVWRVSVRIPVEVPEGSGADTW